MKPPICCVCMERFAPEAGGLVTFRRAPGDDAWYERRATKPGFTGHPPNVGWFCPAHLALAKEHVASTIGEAIELIRKEKAP